MNLYELAFSAYIYDSFTSFNKSYRAFIEAVTNSPDLYKHEHRKELIAWLNKWGCRQFSLDYSELASDELLSWYKEGYLEFIPQDKKLWELTAPELQTVSRVYDSLAEKKASYKIRKGRELSITVGATGASKILFALRPEVAVAWDEAIRKGLKHAGTGYSYVNYLEQARSKIKSLSMSCRTCGMELGKVPRELGRDKATIAQLIGEYFWVTETRKCFPPPSETIRLWADWSQHEDRSVSPHAGDITELRASVGGYTGVSYQVQIDFSRCRAEYSVMDYGYELFSQVTINLSRGKIKGFLKSLAKADIFAWDERYEDTRVVDGTSWSVELLLPGGIYEYRGSNAYPEKWNVFCRAVERLLGKTFA